MTADSIKTKLTGLVKRYAPSGRGFVTGAVTAGVIYVADHVFHVHLLSGPVETALTPFVSLTLAAVANKSESTIDREAPVVAKVATEVQAEVKTVDKQVDPTGTLTDLLTNAIKQRLSANGGLEDALVKTALGELAKSGLPIEAVVSAVKADEPAQTVAASSPAPVVVQQAAVPGTVEGAGGVVK